MDYKIMLEISKTCEMCPLREKCIEADCVLYRIEKIIVKNNSKIKEGIKNEIMRFS